MPPASRELALEEATGGENCPYGGYSSVVEHWIVAPVVAGSIPVTHPKVVKSSHQGPAVGIRPGP